MIGYVTEDKGYAIEVTYNYGVSEYATGTGLASFSLAVDDVAGAVEKASSLGYHARNKAGGVMVIGPDSYRFLLVPKEKTLLDGRVEPMLSIRLHVGGEAHRPRKFKFTRQCSPHSFARGVVHLCHSGPHHISI